MTEAVKVTMKHIRQARQCSRGARTWFERHNLSWEQFLREGIEATKFEETGDPMAIKVAEIARGRR